MRKMILSLGIALLGTTMAATNSSAYGNKTVATKARVENTSRNKGSNTHSNHSNTIADVYQQISFGKNKISFEAFSKAYKGYVNLKKAGKLSSGRNIISIADFSLASTAKRLWVIDLSKKKVLFNTHVAHGQGSGNTYATSFSNTDASHQSSLGFYVTRSTYCGKHGCSLRLEGMDRGFNDNAGSRAVVMHAANYCSPGYVKANNRLGRSWGCPAIAPEVAQPIINTIKDGTCLFIYAPKQKYIQSSKWLNA
jgi:hypothetical protein